MTPLHSTLKRALTIDGREYVLTLSPDALKLTLKGKRNGVELPWVQLVNGEAALAVALHASLGAFAVKPAGTPRTSPARSTPPPTPATHAKASRARSGGKAKRKGQARKR
jgi:hypothetical protein